MFWDDAKAEDLVRNDYPEYLEMWRGYRYPIQRADSLRYFVMYKYGGKQAVNSLCQRKRLPQLDDLYRTFLM